jgi:hypothetical protein
MNASFRTAFWAMCLGLTVPMVLFVGVELTSGGRSARNSSLAASDHRGSLRSYWEKSESKIAKQDDPSDSRPGTSKSSAETKPKSDHVPLTITSRAAPKKKHSREQDPETAEATVTLGPQLESDPTAVESGTARDRRVPAVVTGNRPSVEILDDPGEKSRGSRALEDRLDGIEQVLERLGRALAAQAQREPPGDPVKQTAELLRQLRQARDLEEPHSPIPRLSEPETDDDQPASQPTDKDADPAAPDPARPIPKAEPDAAPGKNRPVSNRPVSKIYRPRHLSGSALQALVGPLLTDGIGKVGAADAGTDESALAAGGDQSRAPANAVVVRDLPEILRKIDRLLLDLDVPPTPVMIEAAFGWGAFAFVGADLNQRFGLSFTAVGLIVSDSAFVVLPLALSVTFTVKLLDPAVPGVPETMAEELLLLLPGRSSSPAREG